MRVAWLVSLSLGLMACGGTSPTAPSAAGPGTGGASTATYMLSGRVHVVGGPAPAGMLVVMPGGPSATVDADGRFKLAGVPVHTGGVPLRVGQHEVRLGFSSTARQEVHIDIRLDLGTGDASVARLCINTPPPLNPTPGTGSISTSMCVGSTST